MPAESTRTVVEAKQLVEHRQTEAGREGAPTLLSPKLAHALLMAKHNHCSTWEMASHILHRRFSSNIQPTSTTRINTVHPQEIITCNEPLYALCCKFQSLRERMH